jgi:uncharacterized membrane protein YoaT (DUF817 family)
LKLSVRRNFALIRDFLTKQALACTSGFLLIGLLALTHLFPVSFMPRYDALLLGCIGIQLLMVRLGLETWKDLGVIAIFHALGLMLELHKVSVGSWSYPEYAYTKFWGVPLYSGFMYSSVASYMCMAWKRLDLRSSGWPSSWVVLTLAAIIYSQFFGIFGYLWIRIATACLTILLFQKCRVWYTVSGERFWMPMSLAFGLIGFMIWVAENVATYLGAWQYANQSQGWEPVHGTKILSWSLLTVVSLIVVAEAKCRHAPVAFLPEPARS